MKRQSKGPRDLEAYCSVGQGPPRAVAPTDDDDEIKTKKIKRTRLLRKHNTEEESLNQVIYKLKHAKV